VQALKADDTQQPLASVLPRPDTSKVYDVAVVGAGPAGMYLANELARRGLSTVVIGGWHALKAWQKHPHHASKKCDSVHQLLKACLEVSCHLQENSSFSS
jgi:heterodisulfide reductase subunit A-like polyferredoxin